ncbi:MAG TPA: hypothetical protein VLL52_15530 [Anaerolineae bacterium]|nr:hypothetical protein [Anaerolineae bacterium]
MPTNNILNHTPDEALLSLAHAYYHHQDDHLDTSPRLTISRARALLNTHDLLDEPTWHRFQNGLSQPVFIRLALYDLFDIAPPPATLTPSSTHLAADQWLPLILTAHAQLKQYPVDQLDPASPPQLHTPAGQILQRTAHFLRQQINRTATERDKLARRARYLGPPSSPPPSPTTTTISPTPQTRPLIPVRYPEYNPEIRLDEDEPTPPPITLGTPITITKEELPPAQRRATPNPSPSSSSSTTPSFTIPPAVKEAGQQFTTAVRALFQRQPLGTTRLRVIAQESPNGPGYEGLQVQINCQNIKSHVAGVTDAHGRFTCDLPVPENGRGLTYDITLTWPRHTEPQRERKSITLNADNPEFTLPFYRLLTT